MPESNRVAIATIGSQPVAVEIAPDVAVLTRGANDLQMVNAKRNLSERMHDLTDVIRNAATGLVESVRALPEPAIPKKVNAEFSLSFGAETGLWYIAKGTATGAIKVTLEWELRQNELLKHG